ncbi:bacteriocin-like protein [Chryseobacterium lactis]|uniref:bacteriocin-like protein n=1 Tax=Chryseobacterium lactis TaxID=1241981 RepID=UPI0038B235B2
MKNLKKLTKSNLKKISGGDAPVCGDNEIPCHYFNESGSSSYWSCEPAVYSCRK